MFSHIVYLVRNFSSFQRLLNLHGFRRSSATARDAYFHPQFLQNQRDVAKMIIRIIQIPDMTDDNNSVGTDRTLRHCVNYLFF